ncbi:TPA: hypothetical protein ACGFXK_002550, partial [Vibrio cholerae]
QEATNSATQAGIATQKAQAASDSERVVLQKAQEVSNNASLVATHTATVVRKSEEVAANTTVVEEKTAVVIEKASEVANNASTVASAIVAHEEKTNAHPNATTTKNGFMSSEDKTKLNGLNVTNSISDTTEGRLLKVGDMLARGRCVLFQYVAPGDSGVCTLLTYGVTQYFDIIITAGWATNNRSGYAHYRVYNAVASGHPYVQTIVAPKSHGGGSFSTGFKFNVFRRGHGHNQPITIEVAKPSGALYYITVIGSAESSLSFRGISFDPTRTSADVGDILNNDTVYHTGNIVGTVSQSGGVPTGAVIQRGINANGEFVRYADGTQICWNNNFQPSATIPSTRDWTYPAAFADTPQVNATPAGAGDVVSRWGSKIHVGVTQAIPSFNNRINGTFARIYFDNGTGWDSASANWSSHVKATGRWYQL